MSAKVTKHNFNMLNIIERFSLNCWYSC